jgi:hypothetical protein
LGTGRVGELDSEFLNGETEKRETGRGKGGLAEVLLNWIDANRKSKFENMLAFVEFGHGKFYSNGRE